MSDKEILSQLNKLKDLRPRAEWKETSRGVLMNQIHGFGVGNIELGFFASIYQSLPIQILRTVSQPVMVVFVLMFVLGGGIVGLKTAEKTKPGDSLYVAKIIGEKTQQVFTFDEKKKLQLEIEFAQNRAEEIDSVLADDNKDNKKVEKMVSDFNNNLTTIKTKLQKMGNVPETVEKVAAVNNSKPAVDKKDDDVVVGANSAKGGKGMETSEKDENPISVKRVATSTKDVNAQIVLKEASELLRGDNYIGTINKLSEVGKIVASIALSKDATSTKENIDGKDGSTVGSKNKATSSETSGPDGLLGE